MRLLCELFVIGGLLYLGWEIPFRDRLPNNAQPVAKSSRALVQQTATPSGAWMHDPNHRSALDTPAPAVAQHQPQPNASRSGSWMFDPNHRSTLDAPRKASTPP
ncbi:MAG: hypothetical protein ACJ8M1_11650 [Chthoniobacterales bacterium]